MTTNYERIKNMTVEEMAIFLSKIEFSTARLKTALVYYKEYKNNIIDESED